MRLTTATKKSGAHRNAHPIYKERDEGLLDDELLRTDYVAALHLHYVYAGSIAVDVH